MENVTSARNIFVKNYQDWCKFLALNMCSFVVNLLFKSCALFEVQLAPKVKVLMG